MYKIKDCAEDFIVKEITDLDFKKSGDYLIYTLKKKNYNTMRAIEQIAKSLGVRIGDIGFAGIKDKNAITEQSISLKGVYREDVTELKLKDIKLTFVGYLDKPLSLGDLKGNEFIITIRGLKKKEISELEKKIKGKCFMPNYFGEQRFSKNNVEIGKMLLKSDFKKALELIFETNPDYKTQMEGLIQEKPNDFVRALNVIPKKLLLLYTHAYQSYLWNKCEDLFVKKNKGEKSNVMRGSHGVGNEKGNLEGRHIGGVKIPLIGFGTEIEDCEVERIVDKVMDDEKVGFRNFINRSIPEISLEGDYRDAFVEVKKLKILEKGDDFVRVSFGLPKGSYATVAVRFLLN